MSATLWLAFAAHALASLLPQPHLPPAPAAASGASAQVQREAWVMGTRARIVTEAETAELATRTSEAILSQLERSDHLLSTWDSASPLSELNRAQTGSPIRVEPELAGLLREALEWSTRTDGAFDPRVGALVDVWDVRGRGRTPSEPELADALLATGSRGVSLEGTRLVRSHEAAWIDSGGFGKGAALRSVERSLVGELPEQVGPTSRVLVDLGGQLLASAPADEPWKVRVAHPSRRTRAVLTLSLHRGSVATTGASERGLHVLDARTGRPVEPWGSVTVVHADALAADILSTALYVMGPEVGLAFAEREGVAALFLTDEAGHLSTAWTSHMTPSLDDASDSTPVKHP